MSRGLKCFTMNDFGTFSIIFTFRDPNLLKCIQWSQDRTSARNKKWRECQCGQPSKTLTRSTSNRDVRAVQRSWSSLLSEQYVSIHPRDDHQNLTSSIVSSQRLNERRRSYRGRALILRKGRHSGRVFVVDPCPSVELSQRGSRGYLHIPRQSIPDWRELLVHDDD